MNGFSLPVEGGPGGNTLFFDGGTNTAALVQKVKGRRQTKQLKFHDPHAALDWCIANRISLVFMPAPDHTGN